MKNIKLKAPFCIPTKDLKGAEWTTLPVTSTIPESKEVDGDIEYKVAIPDFMFDELANTEPKFATVHDWNNKKISGCSSDKSIQKFKKTQTAKLISQLQDYIYSLTQYINERHSIENATLKKKIFIYFNHSQVHTTNGLNNAYWGERISQLFRYFVGYEIMTTQFSEINQRGPQKKYITKIGYASPTASIQLYNTNFKEREDLFLPLPRHNQSMKDFENEFSIVDWTQEREDFCEKIKSTFITVNDELSLFLKDISSKKMDMLMKSNLKFLKE